MFAELASALGTVQVMTTNGRGFSAEELAERAVDQIINVGDNAPPVIADQARAFRENLREVLVYYMREAMRSRDVTLANKFVNAGFPELVKLIDS
tara:strand:+ start:1260 stop:1544 length:285 start_codon:yes stop_codon:yes gene_type:complete